MKQKACKSCGETFTPKAMGQHCCSLPCSIAYDKTKKKARKAKPKKKKTKTIGKLTDEAATLLQRLVRLKAADDNGYVSCVTCGVTKRFDDGMQGGHFRPRGKAATKLMEENVHPQCDSCNSFGMKFHGAEAKYTTYMIDMYGREFVDELIELSDQPYKWCRPDIEDLIKDFSAQIAEHEKRISL